MAYGCCQPLPWQSTVAVTRTSRGYGCLVGTCMFLKPHTLHAVNEKVPICLQVYHVSVGRGCLIGAEEKFGFNGVSFKGSVHGTRPLLAQG